MNSDPPKKGVTLALSIIVSQVSVSTCSKMVLSVKDHYKIVFLATHLLGPKLSPAAIAKYKKASKQTVTPLA